MKKNLGHDIEDRGVEAQEEEVTVDGQTVIRNVPPHLDGTGQPAAAEDAGSD